MLTRVQIDRSDPAALLSAASASKKLYVLAVPLIYRRVCLSDRKGASVCLVRRLAKDGSRLPLLVRELVVQDGKWLKEVSLESMTKVISRAKCLETLRWLGSFNIPQPILQALEESCPRTKLVACVEMGEHINLSSANLHSLICRIPYRPNEKRTARLCLFRIIRSCPSLRRLTITKQKPGCVRYAFQPHEGLNVQPDDRLPQLEELSEELPDPTFLIEDIIKWGDKGGWANLQSLMIAGAITLQAFSGRVPRLQSLQASVSWSDLEQHKSAFSRLGPLQTLVLRGWDLHLPCDILTAYSNTLTDLAILRLEPHHPSHQSPGITVAELQQLNEACPRLQRLQIDLKCDGRWVSSLPPQ